ncbi:MAG: SEL1-like repeat protein [Oscillibacter sp.]|nr:SEL1-like repeat protein [Oscillibacter sp.]
MAYDVKKVLNDGLTIVYGLTDSQIADIEQEVYKDHPEYRVELSEIFEPVKLGPIQLKNKKTIAELILRHSKTPKADGRDFLDHYVFKHAKALECEFLMNRLPRSTSIAQRYRVSLIIDAIDKKKKYLYKDFEQFTNTVNISQHFNIFNWFNCGADFDVRMYSVIWLTRVPEEELAASLKEDGSFRENTEFYTVENGELVNKTSLLRDMIKKSPAELDGGKPVKEQEPEVRQQKPAAAEEKAEEKRKDTALTCKIIFENKSNFLISDPRSPHRWRALHIIQIKTSYDIEKAELITKDGSRYSFDSTEDLVRFLNSKETEATVSIQGHQRYFAMYIFIKEMFNRGVISQEQYLELSQQTSPEAEQEDITAEKPENIVHIEKLIYECSVEPLGPIRMLYLMDLLKEAGSVEYYGQLIEVIKMHLLAVEDRESNFYKNYKRILETCEKEMAALLPDTAVIDTQDTALTCDLKIIDKERLSRPRRGKVTDANLFGFMIKVHYKYDVDVVEFRTKGGIKYNLLDVNAMNNFISSSEDEVTLYVKGKQQASAFEHVMSILYMNRYLDRSWYLKEVEPRYNDIQVQYLYQADDVFVFMSPDTYESYEVYDNMISDDAKPLVENNSYRLLLVDEQPADIRKDWLANKPLEKQPDTRQQKPAAAEEKAEEQRSDISTEASEDAKALYRYEKLAEQGDVIAQFNCGTMYFQGVGTAANKEKALCWYEKAAEQGDVTAQVYCGFMYDKGVGAAVNKEKALYWYEKAAKQGHADAQYYCGTMYFQGEGTAVNKEKALYWYEKAAEQGDVNAQIYCGIAYDKGVGTAVNKEKALYWYEKAAEQGDVNAQTCCGLMYFQGEGTAANKEKALCWYEKAAEQGHVDAQIACGAMYLQGEGTAANRGKALCWYEKAAEQGNVNAQFYCGAMYLYGAGTAVNKEKALYWLKKAAEQGLADAQTLLKTL